MTSRTATRMCSGTSTEFYSTLHLEVAVKLGETASREWRRPLLGGCKRPPARPTVAEDLRGGAGVAVVERVDRSDEWRGDPMAQDPHTRVDDADDHVRFRAVVAQSMVDDELVELVV